ncbi:MULTISPECIES: hypothetical protein [unclassified Mesorhizobium]|uniref:hypothetical protein n=1 Tax=unclassified Mesorhizobium TaxID=325217 RepID=UPI001128EEF0|nr:MULTISPECIES: hypothetical protein [unclassified Mesorhizobium]TPJ57064.1 hypothetical protein FJ443_30455 [Mesorhizobium sp. B2-6-1]TPM19825.1 hypothetical protein FJ953_15615 [Mesorhizobium sp. B2-3-6]TPN34741.1 hypothetical protein FJ979_21370 [Mesorhizobium sp. B1-1-6]
MVDAFVPALGQAAFKGPLFSRLDLGRRRSATQIRGVFNARRRLQGGAQRVDVNSGQRRRNHAFAVARGPTGIEGADRGELDTLEQIVRRRPHPPFTALQSRQARHHSASLAGVGVSLHPLLDRLAVLWTGQLHRDQGADLREHVLVNHRRPLRDHQRAKAFDAAATDDLVKGTE